MATRINITFTADPGQREQALLEIELAWNQTQGRRPFNTETVRDAAGVLTSVQVILPADITNSDIISFLRELDRIARRQGMTFDPPGADLFANGTPVNPVTFSLVDGFENDGVDAAPAAFDVVGAVTADDSVANTGSQSAELDSGAAAGTVALGASNAVALGEALDDFDWTFFIRFITDFGLNNNGVSGAQPITLDLRLVDLVAPQQDVVFRYTEVTDDTTGPTSWGTPAHAGQTIPSSSPTSAVAIPIDDGWHKVRIRRLGTDSLGLQVDSNTENVFQYSTDLRVPKLVEVRHTWGDDLDRFFHIDGWSLTWQVAAAKLAA